MSVMPFEALFEHSSIGIIISNQDGEIERSNLYALKMFGYEGDELNGKKIEVLIPPHLKDRHIIYRRMYNENPQPRTMGSNLNLLAVKKNGDQFPVEISLSYFEGGDYRRIVSFVNDITSRKKSEMELKKLTEELESKVEERTQELSNALKQLNVINEGMRNTLEREQELSELKSRFVSMASHEFRTPLAGILTSVSLISSYSKPEDEHKREKHIQTIKKSVKSLTSILNDFLSLDKLNEGKINSSPTEFCLSELAEEIAEEFRIVSEKEQQIELIQKSTIKMFQDREMLRNIFVNLVSNAVKYSPEKATIKILINQEGKNAVIEFVDQGIGIPEADQKHLFELFFRANNVTTIKGTGLGLNIVKRYLKMMGGEISFTSVENQGTTFVVKLPMEMKS